MSSDLTHMHMEEKKRIGFVELSDEALDLFGYYAQRPNWEVALVISVDSQSYAARMSELLKIPFLDRPNRPALVACDRLIVGKKAGMMEMILDMVEDTEIEVIPLDSAILELAANHGKSQIMQRPDLDALKPREAEPAPEPKAGPKARKSKAKSTPKKTAKAVRKVAKITRTPKAPPPAVAPVRPATPPAPAASPARKTSPRPNTVPGSELPPGQNPESGEYTSRSAFDAGTLLGADLRDKLGALQIDSNGDQLLHEILKMAVRVTHADSGSIMLVDESGTHLRIAVADGLPHWVLSHSRQEVGKGVSGTVFATGKPRLVHGHLAESGSADVRPGLREAASVPILTKEGPIGVLNVSVESEKRLDKSAIGLLNMFAREASGAVLKAISLKKLTGTVHREAVIRQVERLMSLQETLPSRFRSVGEVLSQNLNGDYAHCFVVDSEGKHLVLFGSPHGTAALNTRPIPLDKGFLGWILKNHRHRAPGGSERGGAPV